jgi:hypothetical protein
MSSTHDPILLLEPSNLLEPLDLADRYVNPADPSARPDRDGTAHGTSPRGFARTTTRSASVSAPIERRWRLKSALIVAGALACFGAGAALPQLPDLTLGDSKPAQVASASRQSAPAAGAPIKSETSKPAEPRLNESTSNGSNQSIALAPNVDAPSVSVPDQRAAADQTVPAAKDAAGGGASSCDRQGRSNDDASCLAGAVTNPPAGAVRTPAPDRNSDGSPRGASSAARTATGPIPAKSSGAAQTGPETASGQTADPQRADTRASSRQEERPQPALNNNRRASPRDTAERHTADQQPTADDNVPTARSSDRRQDQDTNRTSSRRRDRAAGDSVPTTSSSASSSDRRPDQDNNRSSSWRPDRYDEYARGDDRRVLGRVPREDDRVVGRSPRYEGPTTIFGPLFGW